MYGTDRIRHGLVMDALDVKILRALLSQRSVAPSRHQVSSSLRSIASRLEADNVTVTDRYPKLRESGALSGWRLAVNPAFLGYRLPEVAVDGQPGSAKPDLIRTLSPDGRGRRDSGLLRQGAEGERDVRRR